MLLLPLCHPFTHTGKSVMLVLRPHQVRATVRKTNARKTAGPDEVTRQGLKDCAEQLTEVFTNIFNLNVWSP